MRLLLFIRIRLIEAVGPSMSDGILIWAAVIGFVGGGFHLQPFVKLISG